MQLKKKLINRSTILPMSSTKLASVLAAFMVKYETDMAGEFADIRRVLTKVLKCGFINGAVLLLGREEVVEKV